MSSIPNTNGEVRGDGHFLRGGPAPGGGAGWNVERNPHETTCPRHSYICGICRILHVEASERREKYCIQGSRCCVTSSRRGDSDLVFKSHGCWLDMLRLDYNGRSIVLNKMDGEETFMRGNLNVTELMDIKVKDLNHVTFCTSKNRQKYGKRPPMEETGSNLALHISF
eukprot:1380631-Amorphochlora_amoeboformis.AAC.1